MLTLSLMGSATVAIGLLPTYEMVGLWAPALLITLRIIQGMGIGGEWGGALLLAYEYAPGKAERLFRQYSSGRRDHRHADGDLYRLADDLFDEAQFLAWGWRIPFLLSSVLVFLGCGSAKISTKRPPLSR